MIHNISYRVFVYNTEDEEKVIQSLTNLMPFAKPEKKINTGCFNNEIIVLSEKISEKRDVKSFVESLLKNCNEYQMDLIKNNLSRKMNNKGNLFLRFDKQAAYDEKWKIVNSGDSIHLKIKIASYPAKKENALNVANDIFNFD